MAANVQQLELLVDGSMMLHKYIAKCHWIRLRVVVDAFLFVLASMLALGNPQWSRVIYIFHAHVMPMGTTGDGFISCPKNYTGCWFDWGLTGMGMVLSQLSANGLMEFHMGIGMFGGQTEEGDRKLGYSGLWVIPGTVYLT